ncbi:hypothetical protein LQG66_03915 [Bradyrhizobium ontarionense]|uniref:Uncharacterized protein n=1 Tax=Bradyrhizobium ontarionense TaxID=2898149 RepID=A0ABY3RDV1_9BRAD|nr:hypothetical protein [Bradyrhizobium sp. A19]UFZ05473.1 hypothetical protein LQG66_03915 [Bradyrhizobium sp. A19]
MTRRRDTEPSSQPDAIVERFAAERVRATRTSIRIAQAMTEAIKDDGRSREEIADAMSQVLGERVTVEVLYQYSSPANERNNIPAHRLMALVAVTGDVRILNAALQDTSFIAIEQRFEPLIRREVAKERLEQIRQEIESADAEWRAAK